MPRAPRRGRAHQEVRASNPARDRITRVFFSVSARSISWFITRGSAPMKKNIAPIDFPDTFRTPSGRWSGLHPVDWTASGFDPVNQECFGFWVFLGFGLIDFLVHYSRFGPDEKKHCTDRFSGHLPDSIRSVVRTASGRLDCIRFITREKKHRSGEPGMFWVFCFGFFSRFRLDRFPGSLLEVRPR